MLNKNWNLWLRSQTLVYNVYWGNKPSEKSFLGLLFTWSPCMFTFNPSGCLAEDVQTVFMPWFLQACCCPQFFQQARCTFTVADNASWVPYYKLLIAPAVIYFPPHQQTVQVLLIKLHERKRARRWDYTTQITIFTVTNNEANLLRPFTRTYQFKRCIDIRNTMGHTGPPLNDEYKPTDSWHEAGVCALWLTGRPAEDTEWRCCWCLRGNSQQGRRLRSLSVYHWRRAAACVIDSFDNQSSCSSTKPQGSLLVYSLNGPKSTGLSGRLPWLSPSLRTNPPLLLFLFMHLLFFSSSLSDTDSF